MPFYGDDAITGTTIEDVAPGVERVWIEIDCCGTLRCICGACCKDTPTELGRFLRRHPVLCDRGRQMRLSFSDEVLALISSAGPGDNKLSGLVPVVARPADEIH